MLFIACVYVVRILFLFILNVCFLLFVYLFGLRFVFDCHVWVLCCFPWICDAFVVFIVVVGIGKLFLVIVLMTVFRFGIVLLLTYLIVCLVCFMALYLDVWIWLVWIIVLRLLGCVFGLLFCSVCYCLDCLLYFVFVGLRFWVWYYAI